VTSFGSWDVLHAVNVTDADWQGWHHVSKSLVGTHTTLVVVTQPRVVPHRLPSPEKRARMHWAIMEAVNENVTKFAADAGIVDLFQVWDCVVMPGSRWMPHRRRWLSCVLLCHR
jgi:hypothetical protein